MDHSHQLRGGVYFVNELPWTASGKLLRRVVLEKAIKLYNDKFQDI